MADVREKLVELLWKYDQLRMMRMSIEESADYLIDNGVTIQRWIPVTERLPEDDLHKGSKVKRIKVYVAYRTNGRWVCRTQTRAKGFWYGEPDEWDWIKSSDPITHWMPLPNLPYK